VARGYALSDPSREQAIVEALQAANDGPMADEAVPDVVAAVLAVTLREVRRLRGQGW
jgi:chorismate mutase